MKKPITGLVFTLLFLLSASVLFATVSVDALGEALSGFTGDHVVGEPKVVGDIVIIPVFSADFSFGAFSGGPDGETWGSGTSGNLNFLPYAIVVVDQKGVRIIPVSNKKSFFEQVMEALPKLMPMVQEMIGYFSVSPEMTVLEQPELESPLLGTEGEALGASQEPDEEIFVDRVSELYRQIQPGLSPENYQEIATEVKALLPQDPGNAKLHAMNAYVTMMLIEKAAPLQQIRMAMEAQKEIDTALSLDPNDLLGLISQGWMNLHNPMGKIDLALSAFEKALSVDSENIEALMGITMVYEKLNQPENVRIWAEKGLALDPENEYFSSLIH